MAKQMQEEAAIAVPDDGTKKGSKYARKAQPAQTNIAFRDFANNLGAYFSRVDNSPDEQAVVEAFLGYNRAPWEMGALTDYPDRDTVKLVARISVLSMEDWDDYPEWKENPIYHMPVDQAYIYEVDKRQRSIGGKGIGELIEVITGIMISDLHRPVKKKD